MLRDWLVKIGAKIVRHGRSITFQLVEVMVLRTLFQHILTAIAALPAKACHMLLTIKGSADVSWIILGEPRSDTGQRSRKAAISSVGERRQGPLGARQANAGES